MLKFLTWAKSKSISLAVCTNKQEKLSVDLLKKLKLIDYFDYVAGSDTFDYNKPDPRHLTNVIEILGGSIKRTLMVGDSEVDAAAKNAKIPFILIEDGYTEKNSNQIHHDILIKDFLTLKNYREVFMISFSLLSALSIFYFTMFITPGPNNAMLTASGMKFGFVKTLPHLIGIPLGHIFQIGLTCLGLGSLFIKFPQIQFYMKILCFLYLIFLGWKMIGSFSLLKKETGRPLKFYEASLFQFINPKAWSIAIAVASGFFPSEENLLVAILFVTLTAAFICFPTISLWALFGNSLRTLIRNTKFKKITEYILAILLILTGIFILIK